MSIWPEILGNRLVELKSVWIDRCTPSPQLSVIHGLDFNLVHRVEAAGDVVFADPYPETGISLGDELALTYQGDGAGNYIPRVVILADADERNNAAALLIKPDGAKTMMVPLRDFVGVFAPDGIGSETEEHVLRMLDAEMIRECVGKVDALIISNEDDNPVKVAQVLKIAYVIMKIKQLKRIEQTA